MTTAPTDPTPAAETLARVVLGVREDGLSHRTPCAGSSVGDLLQHVELLTQGFTWAATKTPVPADVDPTPQADASRLDPAWRTLLPDRLRAMAQAWQDPAAWQGMTQVGGIDLPASLCGCSALDELVLHAWDLARATGQDVVLDPGAVDAALVFVEQVASDDGIPGLFGPRLPVPDGASPVDRLLRLSGRDPGWTA